MTDKKKKDGKGGIVLTDAQKIALIKTGDPNGDTSKFKAGREEMKKRANLPDEIAKRKAKKK